MPVLFGSGRAAVTGGQGAQSFIRRNQDSAVDSARKFIEGFPMSDLRAAVPRRTGALANSLRLIQRGPVVTLFGRWYGRFHRARIEAAFIAISINYLRRMDWIR